MLMTLSSANKTRRLRGSGRLIELLRLLLLLVRALMPPFRSAEEASLQPQQPPVRNQMLLLSGCSCQGPT